jgi:hypothetical protein
VRSKVIYYLNLYAAEVSTAGLLHTLQQQFSRRRMYVSGSSTAGPLHTLQQQSSRRRVYVSGSSTAGHTL